MKLRKKTERLLLTLTFLAGALLLVSLAALRGNIVAASAEARNVSGLHPALRVTPVDGFVEPEEKTVYLTFDDGPSRNTEALLDLLLEEDIKATFFVSAQAEDVEFSRRMLRRMRDEGHAIGLHTYTHRYRDTYASLAAYLDDLARIDAFIYEATGIHADILRFPGGSGTRNASRALMRSIADEVTERGYVFYDWTVASGDDKSYACPACDIAANILEGVDDRKVEIILCHDNSTPATTPDAIAAVIPALRDRGYTFAALTQEVPPVQRVYGK